MMALQFKFILFQNAREGENSNRDTSKEAESDHKQELDINGGGNYWGPKQGKKILNSMPQIGKSQQHAQLLHD